MNGAVPNGTDITNKLNRKHIQIECVFLLSNIIQKWNLFEEVAGQRQLNSEEVSMPASDKGLCLPRLYIATPIRRMQKAKALSRLM